MAANTEIAVAVTLFQDRYAPSGQKLAQYYAAELIEVSPPRFATAQISILNSQRLTGTASVTDTLEPD